MKFELRNRVLTVVCGLLLAAGLASCATSDSDADGSIDEETTTDTSGTDAGGTGQDDPAPTPNPDSPCADQTNLQVVYVNESGATVGFVENYRNRDYSVVSGSMITLKPAGDPDSTKQRCIACPYQAGIRNIKYIVETVSTAVVYPDDLYRPAFACGGRITYTFKANKTVQVAAD